MLPCGTKLFVHVYESMIFLKKMVEIKNLVNFDLFNILEICHVKHDIGHYKLFISCMMVA